MTTQQPGPGKKLLLNIFKLLLLCLALGIAYGYLFIDIPMGEGIDGAEPMDTTYLSIAIGFTYGAALSFVASGLLIIRYLIQTRKQS